MRTRNFTFNYQTNIIKDIAETSYLTVSAKTPKYCGSRHYRNFYHVITITELRFHSLTKKV